MPGVENILLRGSSLASVFLLFSTALLAVSPLTEAAASYDTQVTVQPYSVKTGVTVNPVLMVTNTGTIKYSTLVVVVRIYPESSSPMTQDQIKTIYNLGIGNSTNLTFTYTPEIPGYYSMRVQFYNSTYASPNYITENTVDRIFLAAKTSTTYGATGGTSTSYTMCFVILVMGVIIAVVSVVVFLATRKKKAQKPSMTAAAMPVQSNAPQVHMQAPNYYPYSQPQEPIPLVPSRSYGYRAPVEPVVARPAPEGYKQAPDYYSRPEQQLPLSYDQEPPLSYGNQDSVESVTESPEPVPEPQISDTITQPKSVEVKREWEYLGGEIRIKVAVLNKSPSLIADVRLRPIFKDEVFAQDKVEPTSLIIKEGEIHLGYIEPGEKRVCSIYFDPLICTTSEIEGLLHYRDSTGKLITLAVLPIKISVACPLFFTPESASIAAVRNLVQNNLEKKDSKVYMIPTNLAAERAFILTREVIQLHSVRHVKDFITHSPYTAEAWFYGLTKDNQRPFIILVRGFEKDRTLVITAYSESAQNICGLLAEIHSQFNIKLTDARYINQPLKQITNITIRDSIINRSSLLFGTGAGAEPNNPLMETEGLTCPGCHKKVKPNWKNCPYCEMQL